MEQKTRNKLSKILGIFGIVLILGTFLGFLMGKMNYLAFWAAIIVSGILGFVICPRLRNESSPLLNWLNRNKKK